MAKTLTGLVPIALLTAAFGAAIWFMFERDISAASWVFAVFLAGHGWVHIMFAVPRPQGAAATTGGEQYPFDAAQSWLVTRLGIDLHAVRPLVLALVVVTIVGYLLAALATVGLILPVSAWAGLVVLSTIASLALLVIEVSPALAIGICIDAILLWIVLVVGWSPAAAIL